MLFQITAYLINAGSSGDTAQLSRDTLHLHYNSCPKKITKIVNWLTFCSNKISQVATEMQMN